MKTIAVIDDDVPISDLLFEVLTNEGYGVLRAYSGTEAKYLLCENKPDLILLDLMLPGLSGEELLPSLAGIPVIVVSAKANIQDKVNLLLGGAADYITKPFDISELLARIAVQLRNSSSSFLAKTLHYRELALDPSSHTLTVCGYPVKLTKTEYAILKLLMQHPGQAIAKSVILDKISIDTPDCTDSSLKQHISNLRRKLKEAGGEEYIEAVWGIDFMLPAKPAL